MVFCNGPCKLIDWIYTFHRFSYGLAFCYLPGLLKIVESVDHRKALRSELLTYLDTAGGAHDKAAITSWFAYDYPALHNLESSQAYAN